MEFIGLIAMICGIVKLFGGSTNNKGGLSDIEKYTTFESLRKK